MDLNLGGHPLHSRFQTVVVRRCEDGIAVEAEHLDLRKRGFVPVGSDLQAAGVIHRMAATARLDLDPPALRNLATSIAVPAFEASELTRGESCRDVAGPQPELDRLPLGAEASRSVATAMGGARGCTHLLSLTQLMTSTMSHAMSDAAAWPEAPVGRLFQRSLSIDGAQQADGTVELAAQLSDIFFVPAAAVVNPMDRFGHQNELRMLARIELPAMKVGSIEVAERRRGRADLSGASWQRRDDAVASLVAQPFLGGFAKRVFDRFPDPQAERPLVDVLLALAPTFIQVCACFSEDWPSQCMSSDTLVGIGGMPDACYMWRRDGALHSRKKRADPMGTV